MRDEGQDGADAVLSPEEGSVFRNEGGSEERLDGGAVRGHHAERRAERRTRGAEERGTRTEVVRREKDDRPPVIPEHPDARSDGLRRRQVVRDDGGAHGVAVDRRTGEGGKRMGRRNRRGQSPPKRLRGRNHLLLDRPFRGQVREKSCESFRGGDEAKELRHGHPGMRKPTNSR